MDTRDTNSKLLKPNNLRYEALAALPRNMRKARIKSGMTQEEVAIAVGVSPSYISQIEGGKRIPSLEVMLELSQTLETGVSRLLGFEEVPGGVGIPREIENNEMLLQEIVRKGVETAVSQILEENRGLGLSHNAS